MRDTGPVRFRFDGDVAAAKGLVGVARTQLGIMKNLMGLGNLQQLSRNVTLADGTQIRLQSVFGQDTISINVPAAVAAPEEEAVEVVSAVNQVVDYVGVAMPNPVPYRGVSIGVAAGKTYVIASDGEVLASEPINLVQGVPGVHGYPVGAAYQYVYMDYPYYPATTSYYSGGGDLWLFNYMPGGGGSFHHKLEFHVPEDCIYPAPYNSAPAYQYGYSGSEVDAIEQWNTDWQAGVTAFNVRRTAWFKKNSDEFIAALKTGFSPGALGVTRAELQTGALPASWDYQIKKNYNKDYDKTAYKLADNSFAGHHTKMPIVMSITSAADEITSDTSANLTQAGTKVTKRTTTFAYTDAKGKNWSVAIDGTLTQAVTAHTGGAAGLSQTDTYFNWYEQTYPSVSSYAANSWTRSKQPFIGDRSAFSIGSVWNGAEAGVGDLIPLFGDTAWRIAPLYDMAYLSMSPAWPFYANTLVGTAPDIFLQYHNTVLPVYVKNTAQSSTVLNNSALYNVKQIELILFGLISDGVSGKSAAGDKLGMFWDSTETGTQVEIYGKAIYAFNWNTGSLTFQSWNPFATPKTVTLASTPVYNCLVGYSWETSDKLWLDVAEYLRKKVKTLSTVDPMLYAIIKQSVAG